MTPFSCVADLARRQHRTVSYAQVLRHLSPEQARHLVRTGRLWRVFRGVYALDGPLEPIGELHAAVLYGGERALATRFSAAVLQRLTSAWPLESQIVVAGASGATGPRGIDLHHSRTLRRRDVTTVDGIRCTALPRTIIDCARHLDAGRTKRLLRAAEFEHGLDLGVLDRPGVPAPLRQLLDRYVRGSGLTASELEARFLELCACAGLPAPDRQERLGPFRVDFVWASHRLVVETDGRAAHDRSIAFLDDRRRDRALQVDGWRVLRYAWAEVTLESMSVAAELASIMRR